MKTIAPIQGRIAHITDEPGDMTRYSHIVVVLDGAAFPGSAYDIVVLRGQDGEGIRKPRYLTSNEVKNWFSVFGVMPGEEQAAHFDQQGEENPYTMAAALRAAATALRLGGR